MINPQARKYTLISLEGTPMVLKRMLHGIAAESSFWDFKGDPERFTAREVLAHLADWDAIFLERLTRTVTMDNPVLQGLDEGKIALERSYGSQNARDNILRLQSTRTKLLAYIHSIKSEDWEKLGNHSEIGPITFDSQVVLMLAHDGYHARQLAEYLEKYES